MKKPSSPVVAVRVCPVASLTTSMVTPGSALPDASVEQPGQRAGGLRVRRPRRQDAHNQDGDEDGKQTSHGRHSSSNRGVTTVLETSRGKQAWT